MPQSMHSIPRVTLTLGLLFGLTSAAHAEKQLLRWKLKEGETYSLSISNQTQEKTPEGVSILDAKTEETIDFTWKIEKVRDGNIEIEMKIDRIRFKQQRSNVKPTEWDSEATIPDGESKPFVATLMGPAIGDPVRIVMSELGDIVSIKRPWRIDRGRAGSSAMGVNPGTESFLDNLPLLLVNLPEEPVEIGEVWTYRQQEEGAFGRTTWRTDAKVAPQEESDTPGVIRISADLQIGFRPGSGALRMSFQDLSGTGSWEFDPVAGHMISGKRDWVLTTVTRGRGFQVETHYEVHVQITMAKVEN